MLKKIICFSLTGLLIVVGVYAEKFSDDLGRTVEIKKPPSRIISLAPSATENLFALGMQNQIVGVTRFCSYPEEALKITKVGGFTNPNLEMIVSLQPDLIVASYDGNDKTKVEKLSQIGYPVYMQRADDLDATLDSIELLGLALGKKKEAKKLVDELRKKEKHLNESIKGKEKPRLFFEIGSSRWTISDKTFIGDLIKRAGATNVMGGMSTRYAKVNIEEVLLRKPEIIIISSMANPDKLPALKKAWQKWPTIPAVRNKRIYVIQSDIVNRAGPRIVDALEKLIKIIHFSE